jgi:hypothetical protein
MSPSSGEDLTVYNRRISIELQGEGANLSIHHNSQTKNTS